jgi:hypothetical protein
VFLLVLAAVLLVVAVGLAFGYGLLERRLHALAEARAAAFLAGPFGHPPVVRVHGGRFLGQALRGRYAHIDVAGDRLHLGDLVAHDLRATLTDAVLPSRDLLARRATALTCARVEGTLVLPYPALARMSRVPGLTLTFRRGRLRAEAALPVLGVNSLARVSGDASLELDAHVVRLRVDRLGVAGMTLPGTVLNQLLPTLNVTFALPPLPYGLRVDALTPTAAGLVVHGSADDAVFR